MQKVKGPKEKQTSAVSQTITGLNHHVKKTLKSIKLFGHGLILWYKAHRLRSSKEKHETKLKNKESEIAQRIEHLRKKENKEISDVRKYYADELAKVLHNQFNRIKADFFSDATSLKNKFDKVNDEFEHLKRKLNNLQYEINQKTDQRMDAREHIIETKRDIHNLKGDLADASDDWSHGKQGRYLTMRDINDEIHNAEGALLDLEEEETELIDELERLKSERPYLEDEVNRLEHVRQSALREYETVLDQTEREWSNKADQVRSDLQARYAPKYYSERDNKIANIHSRYNALADNVPKQVQLEIDELKNILDKHTTSVKETEQTIKKLKE